MKEQIRDYFPGGNTPFGFHSYYNHILSQNKAEKIFCIKGGPGVGKSTLMKEIGSYFIGKGVEIERFWCSADPDSLDAIHIIDYKTLLVDGTAPHIIDPINPGAVDEIIDLGEFLNYKGLKNVKNEIIDCGETISQLFNSAYANLNSAYIHKKYIETIMNKLEVSVLERFEDIILDLKKKECKGSKRKLFASAITSKGIVNKYNTLLENISKVIFMEIPLGTNISHILNNISESIVMAGYDADEFYCPMDHTNKLDHIISYDAGIAIITVNEYHMKIRKKEKTSADIINVKLTDMIKGINMMKLYSLHINAYKYEIENAIKFLAEAKHYHDKLESYYIPNMDFEKIEGVKEYMISSIENSFIMYNVVKHVNNTLEVKMACLDTQKEKN